MKKAKSIKIDFPSKDALKLLSSLEKKIKYDFGKKCPDYNKGCFCCQIWKAFSTIKRLYSDD